MKTYAKSIENRRDLVERLEQLTGLSASYTRVPRCAYEIGAFTVEREGELTVQDGADESILRTLQQEGLIGECVCDEQIEASDTEDWDEDAEPEDGDTEDWDEDTTETDETENAAEDWEEITEEPDSDEGAEPEEEATGEQNEDEGDDGTPAEDVSDDEEGSPTGEDEPEESLHFPLDINLRFPLAPHTVTSILNLVSILCTRGDLISKSTGGAFSAEQELVEQLKDKGFTNRDEAISYIQSYDEGALRGIRFEDEELVFDGFKQVPDDAHLQTFIKLATAINRASMTQKRVKAKKENVDNERYTMRIWLVRIGMNGKDTKPDRKLLMEHLGGHTAFRTSADAEKWKRRQQEKRDALRQAKTADSGEAGEG